MESSGNENVSSFPAPTVLGPFTSFHLSIFAAILIYVCLFKFKNPIQLYVKYTTYVVITMMVALLFAPIAALRPCNPENIG